MFDEQKLKMILADILEMDVNQINNETSPKTVEQWDSLKHMNIVTAIEEEFEIYINDNDIADMLNYQLIKEILKAYVS